MMGDFLKNIGFLAICFAVAYVYKKILEYYDLKRMGLREDERVYRAAGEFARGTPSGEVKAILAGCSGLDGRAAESILSAATPHRAEKDGGRRAFLRAVNEAVGDEIYDEKRPPSSGNGPAGAAPGEHRRLSK